VAMRLNTPKFYRIFYRYLIIGEPSAFVKLSIIHIFG